MQKIARLFSAALMLWAVLVVAAALVTGKGELLLAAVPPAAPAANRIGANWFRKHEPMKAFNNVVAGTAAVPATTSSLIPRYRRAILGFVLEKGGTAFTNTHIPRIEMFLGEKSIWGPVSATDLQMVERYIHGEKESGQEGGNDSYFLPIDFTFANVKEIGGEQIGGLDLSTLADGQLRLEVDIGAATAPTLKGHVIWGAPQGGGPLGGLMHKLVRRNYAAAPAGDWNPDIQMRGAILARQYFKGAVYNNAVVTAFTAANHGTVNTGTGACTATVGSLTPAGRYTAICIEPGANVGTFEVRDPKGKSDGTVTVAAGAITLPSGLVVTIADATDFISGDGFYIDVLPNNTDGNTNVIEVKKNEDFWWFRTSRAARFLQQKYGRTPMAGLEVVDWLLDNHIDSLIDTADAAALDYRVNLTATDTLYIVNQVLARPIINA